jgi:hypothetical protein
VIRAIALWAIEVLAPAPQFHHLGTLSLHIAPVSGMIAPARCAWAPPWSANLSHSYGLSEGQVQARLDKRGPG